MPPMPELATWHFGALASVLAAYVVPLVTAGLGFIYEVARMMTERKRARDARRAAEEESAILDEGDTILRGRVEYARGRDFAAKATVVQDGSEAESSGSWTVTWKERARTTEVVPFYVVHASSERARVEPGPSTILASDLVATERVNRTTRHRIARLAADEEVWVTGLLAKDHDPEQAGGYRGGRAWVMRPLRRQPMIISTALPEAGFLKNAARAFLFALLFALLFAVMVVSHTQYHALVLDGVSATATVIGKENHQSDDNETYHLSVKIRSESGKEAIDDWQVTLQSFNQMKVGDTVPSIASFGAVQTSLPGSEPQALFASTLATFIAWVVAVILAASFGRKTEWYEGEPTNESNSGRLDDT